jgi:large subunit ribosomal protein L30
VAQRKTAASSSALKLKLIKSPVGYNARQRATVQSLGLRRLHQVVVQPDSPITRGMIEKVKHLVQVIDE